jgi:AraC-like DNA-binding protein
MLSDFAPTNEMSSGPRSRRGAALRPSAPPNAIDRLVRIGHSHRNDREETFRPHGGATGIFRRIVEIRPHNVIEAREAFEAREALTSRRTGENLDQRPATTTRIAEEVYGQGESLLRLLIDEGESLNRLYNIVSQAGCDILLYDEKGSVICHYGKATDCNRRSAALEPRLGGVVAEDDEQTPATGRPTIYAPNASLDYWKAPIFNAEGDVIGYLEALPADRDVAEGAFALTRAAVTATARAIEERSFRKRYRREWIIALAPGAGVARGMLLAVDRRQCIVGADRHARAMLSGANNALRDGHSVWALFDKNPALFRNTDVGDVRTVLVPAGAAESWSAVVTPPESGASYRRSPEQAVLHCRPRLDSIGYFHEPTSPAACNGGLAPRVLQRVREYIDAHLGENIELEALADTAGLSRCHFARAFKQSVGTAPHCYLMQRRLERAKQLIIETRLPLAEIALECGFSDQSHFSRRFLQYVGVTPRSFRWSAR